jgi:hypothetical protein
MLLVTLASRITDIYSLTVEYHRFQKLVCLLPLDEMHKFHPVRIDR